MRELLAIIGAPLLLGLGVLLIYAAVWAVFIIVILWAISALFF